MFEGATKFLITVIVLGFILCLAVFRGCRIPDWEDNPMQTAAPYGQSARGPSDNETGVGLAAEEGLYERIDNLETGLAHVMNQIRDELGASRIDRAEISEMLDRLSQDLRTLREEVEQLTGDRDDVRADLDRLQSDLDALRARVEALDVASEALQEQSASITQIAHWSLVMTAVSALFFVLTFVMVMTAMPEIRRTRRERI